MIIALDACRIRLKFQPKEFLGIYYKIKLVLITWTGVRIRRLCSVALGTALGILALVVAQCPLHSLSQHVIANVRH